MQPMPAAPDAPAGNLIQALTAVLTTGDVTITHAVLDDLACTYDTGDASHGLSVQLAYDLPAADQERALVAALLAAHDAVRAGDRFGGFGLASAFTAAAT